MTGFSTARRQLAGALAVSTVLCGCAAGYASQRTTPRGFLRLEVEPPDAEVAIDETYSGVANGWADGVIPVTPGICRLTLSAEGYETQRFDIEVAPYEEVTLVLALERRLEVPDDETAKSDDPFRPSLRAIRE